MQSPLSLRRIGRFVWAHKAWPLLLPVLFLVGEALHGGAHAATIIALGGRIDEWHLLPTLVDGTLTPPNFWYHAGPTFDPWIVLLVPIALEIWIALGGRALVARISSPLLAKSAAIFLCLLPIGCISFSLSLLVAGPPENCFYFALVGREAIVALLALAILPLFGALGWRVFRHAFGPVLSRLEYALGYALLMSLPWALHAAIRAY